MVWEGRQDQVLEMRASAFCDAKCMKDMWKEHKRHEKCCQSPSGGLTRSLAEFKGKQLRTGLDEIPQQIIAETDVVSLCRTDSAVTGVEERKAW